MIPSYLLNAILSQLKQDKRITDSFFDQIYPEGVRKVSPTHWTPLEVVKTAVDYFSNYPTFKILDIGSGCGKFCHAGAVLSPNIEFSGVEQRKDLTQLSLLIAQELKLPNASFINASAFDLDWNEYDALYFFNPFWENHLDAKLRIDCSLPIKKEEFDYFIEQTILRLKNIEKGKHVITYHGFGGKMPPQYECFFRKSCGTDQIEIWKKVSR